MFLKIVIGCELLRRQQALAQDIWECKTSALLDITSTLVHGHQVLVVLPLVLLLVQSNHDHHVQLGILTTQCARPCLLAYS